ncbi:SDR family oxidoreductase [Pseudaestuariivita rosea]|uniref:SDR family oxidoreductase n=1 Tax=Pseudaestuariivita rosea TaxID=2763263 RepID=UPI001ABA4F39|nr:SDR family oxidoreductase [Pseudaestuariivita rosea]
MTEQIALVTGASSGLGAQFSRVLAANGYTVIAAARREDRLTTLCDEIADAGGKAHPLQMDVTDIAGIAATLDKTEAMAGPITCLINNAGIGTEQRATDVTPDDFDHIMTVNLKAPFFLATEMGRRWIGRKQEGRIVNVSSLSVARAIPGLTTYAMTKAAISHMTRMLAREWINVGINVNAVAPGYIKTEINEAAFDTDKGKQMIAMMPRRRIGEPSDLDQTILYLADPAQRFLTGQVIYVDDGQGL